MKKHNLFSFVRRRFSVIGLLFLFSFHFSYSQNPLVKQWDMRFGGDTTDVLTSFHQTFDGGYILGGWSYSGISGDKSQASRGKADYWIVKTDPSGNKLWERRFGGTGSDQLNSINQTADGGYILGGHSDSGIGGDRSEDNWDHSYNSVDYWVVKIDSLGNKQWDKRYGGSSDDYLFHVQQTNDFGYVLGGYSHSGIAGDKTQILQGNYDYWIVKIDSVGSKQWDKDFGSPINDFLHAIQQTTDGGYMIGGSSASGIGGDKTEASKGLFDYWILKLDSLGNRQWDKDFGGLKDDLLYSMQQTSDGGFILGGYSNSDIGGDKTQGLQGNSGDIDYWIVKIDSLGNKQWDKDFGGTTLENKFGNISQTNDNGYLMAGNSYSSISGDKTENNLGQVQTWTIKTDSLGIKQWDKTLLTNSAANYDATGLAVQTRGGCYAFANSTSAGIGGDKTHTNRDTSTSKPSQDYWIIKFCDSTRTGINELNTLPFFVYPNPSTSSFTLELSSSMQDALLIVGQAEVIIYDLPGKEQLRKKLTEFKTEIRIGDLAAGVYFVKVMQEGKMAMQKIVKM